MKNMEKEHNQNQASNFKACNESPYNLRSKMGWNKCKLISSPLPPIKSSEVDQKLHYVKLRPKVMVNSSSISPPCKRVLDFGNCNRGIIRTKSMRIYTNGGYCFTRKVRVICDEKEEEEEEWWEKEQELFKQRALFFIASLRLVQGNRPFMGWKASVVDSVVGVFLTQNAADNSSSSAFMSLAAKYPKDITTGDLENKNHTEHALDWNAVRSAQLSEVSQVIQERGMNKRIAERIKKFLDKVHDDKSGLLDLEWLRKAKPEEAMEYFMGVFGLGLKSMECLRLLTLRQRAFPVDRHVCRIVVRLGWVPIEKLPDGVHIHQLKEYPMMKHVQEYLSQRLSNLDVETLYELHYQLITFGKVFCTKKKPNCKSCPMRKVCKHFASATTRGPQVENTFVPITPGRSECPTTSAVSNPFPELEDIEDLCCGRKDNVHPRISKTDELMTNIWNYMGDNNIPLEKDYVSEALITLSGETFSPARILKVTGRLSTKHRVYELHDSHPLVQQLDRRDPDDKNPYLLAIWPPEECCSLISSDSQQEETVSGTLLVPCRTATRGSFPLDGTFFQINEVFADDESSEIPLLVPRKLLLDLTTKALYCGTSISSIFEGMSTKEIQECFWKGYVCVRGFSMKTRAPKPLHEQFHRGLTKTATISKKGKSPRKGTKTNGTSI